MTLPVAVLISGRGSNLQAIIDNITAGKLPIEICVVISDRPDAAGLLRAQQVNIATAILDYKSFPEREDFNNALMQLIDQHSAKLVVLAGFMRILSAAFISHYAGRILNIHPSLLPNYQGLHTHEQAIKDNVKTHGASVHFVTEELDGGPVIMQAVVPVTPDDDVEQLAMRVLVQEHQIYPVAIAWYAQGRIRLEKRGIVMDGELLKEPVRYTSQILPPSTYTQGTSD